MQPPSVLAQRIHNLSPAAAHGEHPEFKTIRHAKFILSLSLLLALGRRTYLTTVCSSSSPQKQQRGHPREVNYTRVYIRPALARHTRRTHPHKRA